MVTTIEILPAPALAPFVRCYSYREFSTGGEAIVKPWYAAHELNFIFFFCDIPVKMDLHSGGIIHGNPAGAQWFS
jgi:hypothetical protein